MAKIPFGTLNVTIAKMIALNSPKRISKLVEPFGDGGSFALYLAQKRPREHVLNLLDEVLFSAFQSAQTMAGPQFSSFKKRDWVGSQEAFDKADSISATEGPDFFYRFMYLRLFGKAEDKLDPESPMVFDPFLFGEDKKKHLNGLPLMRVALKKVTLVNEEPFSLLGSGDFNVLLPSNTEDADATKAKLSGLGASYFFAKKMKDDQELISTITEMPDAFVTPSDIASIMMASYAIVTNYETTLEPVPDEVLQAAAA